MKNIYFLILSIFFLSCGEDDVEIITLDDLLAEEVDFSKEALIADGQDEMRVRFFFKKGASIERISGSCEITNAVFADNDSSEIALVPIRQRDSGIVATVRIKSTTDNVSSAFRYTINNLSGKKVIFSTRSVPERISLSPSAFAVENSFGSEISITGTLFNTRSRKVSRGTKVRFEDNFSNGTPVNGRFRETQASSNADSKVSTIYSPGPIEEGQDIFIKVIVLDEEGNDTTITETVTINVL